MIADQYYTTVFLDFLFPDCTLSVIVGWCEVYCKVLLMSVL